MKRFPAIFSYVCALLLALSPAAFCQEEDFDFDDNPEEVELHAPGDYYETSDPKSEAAFDKLFEEISTEGLAKFKLPASERRDLRKNDFVFSLDDDRSGLHLRSVLSEDEEFEIPAEFDGKPVVGLANVSCSSHEELRKVVLPETIKTIGGYVFLGCENLEEVAIPAGVVEIGGGLFERCPKVKLEGVFDANPIFAGIDLAKCDANPDARGFLWYERKEDHVAIRGYVGEPREITIPEEIDGKPVTEIGANAFSCCHTLEKIVFPKTLQLVGDEAFIGCNELTSAALPESVAEIGTQAFGGCYLLDAEEAFRAPAKFGGISAAKLLKRPKTKGMVWYEIDGEEITIRDFVSDAVYVKIPSEIDGRRVVALGDNAFFQSVFLTSVTIPEGVKSIGAFCFKFCENLYNVSLPSTLTTLKKQAFGFCPSIATLTVPASVETIEPSAFIGCFGLNLVNALRQNKRYSAKRSKEINADGGRSNGYFWYEKRDDGVVICGYVGHPAPAKTRIPDLIDELPVVEIGDHAFNLTPWLEELALPDTVTRIGDSAFDFCRALKKVRLPKNLKTLERDAFSQSASLKSVVLPEGLVELGPNVFNQNVVLYAPKDGATAETLKKDGYQESR